MKLFLSWSGSTSHKIATVLRDWIPLVLQSVEPYVSSEDIDKGTRWSSDIAKELEESRYGIICVTDENLRAPWVNFEAGALSKTIEKSNVAPFLFNIKKSEVDGPLLQFQLTIYEKEDIRKLIYSINNSSDGYVLDKPKLDRIFDQWWPSLETSLEDILKECAIVFESVVKVATPIPPLVDANNKILEELLELARLQVKILKNPEELLPVNYLNYVFKEIEPRKNNPSVNSMALRDLDRHYRQLRTVSKAISDNLSEIKTNDFVELFDIIRRLEDPVDFLVRKNRGLDTNYLL